MKYVIYCIENKKNKKRYVGKSKNYEQRKYQHISNLRSGKHKNNHLQNSWNKYGEDNFIFYILAECKKKDLNKEEMFYIKKYKTKDRNFGYNMTSGGDGSINPREETRERMRKNHADFRGEKGSMWGKKHTPEALEKIGAATRGKVGIESSTLGRKHPNATSPYYGVHWSNVYKKWIVRIRINGKIIKIGDSEIEESAAKIWDNYVIKNKLQYPINFGKISND